MMETYGDVSFDYKTGTGVYGATHKPHLSTSRASLVDTKSSSSSCVKDEEEEFEMSGDPHAPQYYTWYGFVRKTSFHGVKYLFDGHPWRLRKYVWRL